MPSIGRDHSHHHGSPTTSCEDGQAGKRFPVSHRVGVIDVQPLHRLLELQRTSHRSVRRAYRGARRRSRLVFCVYLTNRSRVRPQTPAQDFQYCPIEARSEPGFAHGIKNCGRRGWHRPATTRLRGVLRYARAKGRGAQEQNNANQSEWTGVTGANGRWTEKSAPVPAVQCGRYVCEKARVTLWVQHVGSRSRPRSPILAPRPRSPILALPNADYVVSEE